MRTIVLCVSLCASSIALAGGHSSPPPPSPSSANTSSSSSSSQAHANSDSTAIGVGVGIGQGGQGGQGGKGGAGGSASAAADFTNTLASTSAGGQSDQKQGQGIDYHPDSFGVAFGTAAPIPLAPMDCYVPGKGFKRGHTIAWGLWQASAIVTFDAACYDRAEKRVHDERTYQLDLLKAQADLERARALRITAEREFVQKQSK